MATEIERKFLVKSDQWRNLSTGTHYRQGYIITQDPKRTVRIRIAGDKAYLTIKGEKIGISRAEFEYEIPLEDANMMLDTLCDRPLIEKTRYKIKQGELTWEIDEFLGDNLGLIVAEVELQDEKQMIDFPEWIGQEVTEDLRYYNASLAQNPYTSW